MEDEHGNAVRGGRGSVSAPSVRAVALDDDDDDLEGGDRFDASGWLDKAAEDIHREPLVGERDQLVVVRLPHADLVKKS